MDLTKIGQEYILNLAGDLGQEYEQRQLESNQNKQDLLELTDKILPILFENADDISAVDLLLDIEELNRVHNFINSKNYKRLFEYLLSYVDYSADEDE